MKSINTIITEIQATITVKTIDAIWERVACINSMLDDAYGSALGGYYGSALECAAEAVKAYEELIELCANTTEQPLREHLRDAVGSVKLDKFELPVNMRKALEEKRNKAANPGYNTNKNAVIFEFEDELFPF